MTCEEARELIDAHALGALDAEEAARLDQHIAECGECADALAHAREIAGLLPLAAPLHAPPPTLWNRVLDSVTASPAGVALDKPGSPPSAHSTHSNAAVRRSHMRIPYRMLTVAAALGGLAIGIAGFMTATSTSNRLDDVEGRNDRLAREIAELQPSMAEVARLPDIGGEVERMRTALTVLSAPDVQALRMEGYGPASGAVAYYYWSRGNQLGVLLCNNLPSAPAGQQYELWIKRGERVENSGVLYTSANGTALAVVPLGSEPVTQMGVSMKPVQFSAPNNPGTTVLLSSRPPASATPTTTPVP